MSETTIIVENPEPESPQEDTPDISVNVEPVIVVETPTPEPVEDAAENSAPDYDERITALEIRVENLEVLAAREVEPPTPDVIDVVEIANESVDDVPEYVEDDAPRSQRTHWLFRPLSGPGGWINR